MSSATGNENLVITSPKKEDTKDPRLPMSRLNVPGNSPRNKQRKSEDSQAKKVVITE